MDRQPVVAGQFYPGDGNRLRSVVQAFLQQAGARAERPTLAAMCPHAGYMFSGGVAGQTLGAANIGDLALLLGPNHTGAGSAMAVWTEGRWLFPGGDLAVDEEFADAVIASHPSFTQNTEAHVREHSLEVVAPFLHALNPDTRILPIAISEPRLSVLIEAGEALAALIKGWKERVSIVVSSDMNHFKDEQSTRRLDSMALDKLAALDPLGLYETVRGNNISMCGVLPMTMALAASNKLGASDAEIVAYSTSAEASGDTSRVVGYAGALVS